MRGCFNVFMSTSQLPSTITFRCLVTHTGASDIFTSVTSRVRTMANMMTSSTGNIFRVTGHLCGEFTGPGEFPAQSPVTQLSLISAWINGWVNNREAGDLRRNRANYDVTVMKSPHKWQRYSRWTIHYSICNRLTLSTITWRSTLYEQDSEQWCQVWIEFRYLRWESSCVLIVLALSVFHLDRNELKAISGIYQTPFWFVQNRICTFI